MFPHPPHDDTILMVDDDVTASTGWAEGLKNIRPVYTVLTAASVKSAIDLYHRHKMACVVLDLDMNGESGFEVLFHLIPDRHHREIPVIILTRLLNKTIHSFALEHGAHACLVKSRTSPELLDNAIQTAIASLSDREN
jgi:two-component system sensor histidine kinase ChiS